MFAQSQKEVAIERTFNCWSEATQRDTTLTFSVKYGKILASQPTTKILALDLYLSQGNPNIQAVSALFCYATTISATKPAKILGMETTSKYEKMSIASQISFLRSSFITAKELYENWSKVAKEENVISYHKPMTDKHIYDVPCIFRCFSENKIFFYSNYGSQKDILKMEFVVDQQGNCKLFWGFPQNIHPKFYRDEVEAQYGGLIKKNITKSFAIKATYAGLWFTSAEQIQSLIDALETNSIEKECEELYTEKNKKDSRDELFK